jgi:CheY-like chemotaxis protein
MAAMTNTRKILIVDDDAELRDAMVEQLALHENSSRSRSIAAARGCRPPNAAKSIS